MVRNWHWKPVTCAAAALASAAAAQPCIPGWHSVEGGPSGPVHALASFHESGRTTLFAGGNFGQASGIVTGPVARWDGVAWSAVGAVRFALLMVYTMVVFDDGGGPALYIGGTNQPVPEFPFRGVARWDGTQWSGVGDGLYGAVHALAVHDDGAGPALYAGGEAMWIPAYGQFGPRNLARWTGQTWEPVGGGTNGTVRSIISFDDGSGPALFVSGPFTSPPSYTVRWKDASWVDTRGTWTSVMARFVVFDDGAGPALYSAGSVVMGTTVTGGLMRWNGSDWVVIGTTDSTPSCATVWDDSTGPAIYIGGSFNTVNGAPMPIVARCDGSTWSGVDGAALYYGGAFALMGFDDPAGPALYAGGGFNIHAPTRYIARYYTCNHPGPCYPNCDASSIAPILNVEDFTCFINEFVGGLALPPSQQLDHYANCDQSTTPPILNVSDFTCFINAFAQGCP
jgi:trimeric autotransporter adhesin